MSASDIGLWNLLTQSIRPLRKQVTKRPVPPRLHVYAAPKRQLMDTLDFHGMTLEQAHRTLKSFVAAHIKAGSKTAVVITGKGSIRPSSIRQELPGWIQTPYFADKIRSIQWMNGDGAAQITFKRIKK